MAYSIAELNQMEQGQFTAALGMVFEKTPAIATAAWAKRPFADLNDLHQKMVEVVNHCSLEEQLALIRVHPDLASKVKMAAASVQEQASVGLDRLSSQEYERFQWLNQSYKDKFDFPFVIAVRTQTKASILETFASRLNHSPAAEIRQALAEIAQIAWFRLLDRVK